jgi:hypothetical protein
MILHVCAFGRGFEAERVRRSGSGCHSSTRLTRFIIAPGAHTPKT